MNLEKYAKVKYSFFCISNYGKIENLRKIILRKRYLYAKTLHR